MTISEIQQAFKIICKMIHIDTLAVPQAEDYWTASTALTNQSISGLPEQFGTMKNVCIPVHNVIDALATAISNIPTQMKAAISNYLSKVVALQLDLVVNTDVATVIDALIVEMDIGAQKVLTSGEIATYFDDVFSKELPHVGSGETILDSWVSASFVA